MAYPDVTTAQPPRYDGLSIALHWLTATLVATLYALGELWDLAGRRTPLNANMKSVHISLGILLAAVLLARLAWRAMRAAPTEVAMPAWMRLAARATHWALYALLLVAIPLGLTAAWGRTTPVAFFGLFTIPAPFTLARGTARSARELHELAANAIMAVAALHAFAALWHHYALRDNVLRQMLPSRLLARTPPDSGLQERSGTKA